MGKRIAIFAVGTVLGLVLLVGGAWLYQTYIQAPPLSGIALESPKPAYDFELLSGEDEPVRLSDFRGKVVAVYFGYTFCPDVCPKTLSDLAAAVKLLSPDEAAGVQVLFISVDPERDTPVRTLQYAQSFHPSFVGMTGTPDDIARVAGAFGVFYQRQEAPNSSAGYLVDHSATVMVVDRQGLLRTIWPYDHAREYIVNDLRSLLRQ